jgi:hypothetical protein
VYSFSFLSAASCFEIYSAFSAKGIAMPSGIAISNAVLSSADASPDLPIFSKAAASWICSRMIHSILLNTPYKFSHSSLAAMISVYSPFASSS